MTNSRSKGKRGELELAHWLTDHGHPAWRRQQFNGTDGSDDVACPSLDRFHIEVKRAEQARIHKWLEQAERDRDESKCPVVFWRKNRTDWVVVMTAEDFLRIAGGSNP